VVVAACRGVLGLAADVEGCVSSGWVIEGIEPTLVVA
jgi:hypothetical protein